MPGILAVVYHTSAYSAIVLGYRPSPPKALAGTPRALLAPLLGLPSRQRQVSSRSPSPRAAQGTAPCRNPRRSDPARGNCWRISSHQHLTNPHHTRCTTKLPLIPISVGLRPSQDLPLPNRAALRESIWLRTKSATVQSAVSIDQEPKSVTATLNVVNHIQYGRRVTTRQAQVSLPFVSATVWSALKKRWRLVNPLIAGATGASSCSNSPILAPTMARRTPSSTVSQARVGPFTGWLVVCA